MQESVADAIRLLRETRHQYRFQRATEAELRQWLGELHEALGSDGIRLRWQRMDGASALVWLAHEGPADFA